MPTPNGTATLAKATPRADLSEKRCGRCSKRKLISSFGRNRSHADGVQWACFTCCRAYRKKWYRENKARNWAIEVRSRAKRKERIREAAKKWVEKQRDGVSRWRARQAGVKVIHYVDRVAIFKRDRGICWLCEKPVAKKDRSLDHVKPLSLKGPHTARNVRLAHTVCNKRRGNRLVSEMREAMHG